MIPREAHLQYDASGAWAGLGSPHIRGRKSIHHQALQWQACIILMGHCIKVAALFYRSTLRISTKPPVYNTQPHTSNHDVPGNKWMIHASFVLTLKFLNDDRIVSLMSLCLHSPHWQIFDRVVAITLNISDGSFDYGSSGAHPLDLVTHSVKFVREPQASFERHGRSQSHSIVLCFGSA